MKVQTNHFQNFRIFSNKRYSWENYLKACLTRATTTVNPAGEIVVIKGPDGPDGPNTSRHQHPPNRDLADAEEVRYNLKRRVEEHPELPPSAMVRTEFDGLDPGVLAMMPERPNITRAMRRARGRNIPTNPTSIYELHEIPDMFKVTTSGDNFLIYDSRDDDELDTGDGRVLVFATRRNLELLASSEVWYLDGTFKVSPNIFTQVFTILGSKEGNRRSREAAKETVSLPFVYTLLSSKEGIQYAAVLRSVVSAATSFGIRNFEP